MHYDGPMTKAEEFRVNMRALGYVATDAQFDELARLTRMSLRLGIAENNAITLVVIAIWGHMLTPMLVPV